MNGIKTEKDAPPTEEQTEEAQLTEPVFNDLLQQLESYTPTCFQSRLLDQDTRKAAFYVEMFGSLDFEVPIPDSVAEFYLNKSGVNTDDARIVRLIALASQKFIADIVNDSMQLHKMKGSAQTSRSSKSKDKKVVLTMEDLAPVLAERGIKVRKPTYFT